MNDSTALYKVFLERFKRLATDHPEWFRNMLSNIFTMREIGNKTHGDLAEIAITEFIVQFMGDEYSCEHVGKKNYRSKKKEEDIVITEKRTKKEIPVSLKAYGDGALQLSTDKNNCLFPKLEQFGNEITDKQTIQHILQSHEFVSLDHMNVMPLIYREKDKLCSIMVFDFDKMKAETARIFRVNVHERYDIKKKIIVPYKSRKHPIYVFLDNDGGYICEVRYGGADNNGLQRGLWTNTKNALPYFKSLVNDKDNGWISYKENKDLVKLFRLALNSTQQGHVEANVLLQKDIDKQKA